MHRATHFVVVVFVSIALLAGIAAVPSAADDPDPTVEFDTPYQEVEQGDIVTFELSLEETETATITFEDEPTFEAAIDYEATVTVEDDDGDGTVVVHLDTATLATGDVEDAIDVGDGATISDSSQTDLEQPLDPVPYALEAHVGTELDDDAPLATIDLKPGDDRATFAQSEWTVEHGDEVAVDVDLGEYDQRILRLGNEDDLDYEATVTVEDDDGNGTATVVFDTTALGVESADEAIEAGPGTTISDRSQTDLENPLVPYDYNLDLRPDGGLFEKGATLEIVEDADEETATDDGSATDNGTADDDEPTATGGDDTLADDEPTATGDGDTSADGMPGFGLLGALGAVMLVAGGVLGRSPKRLFLAVLVVTVLAVGVAPFAVAADEPDHDVEFEQHVWTAWDSETTAVELELEDTDTVELTLEASDEAETGAYEAELTVDDANENGSVTVVFDTEALGVASAEEAIEAGPGTAVSDRSQTDRDAPLEEGAFDLTVTVDDTETAVAVFDVVPLDEDDRPTDDDALEDFRWDLERGEIVTVDLPGDETATITLSEGGTDEQYAANATVDVANTDSAAVELDTGVLGADPIEDGIEPTDDAVHVVGGETQQFEPGEAIELLVGDTVFQIPLESVPDENDDWYYHLEVHDEAGDPVDDVFLVFDEDGADVATESEVDGADEPSDSIDTIPGFGTLTGLAALSIAILGGFGSRSRR